MKDLSEVSRHTPMPSDIEDTTTDDKKILEGLPLPEAGLKPLNYREQFSGKASSHFIDPCAEASKASMECLNRNNYEKGACRDYFQAYRDCKKAWLQQRKDDRNAGRPTK
ncbi:Mitochondrial copper homeostasis protein [Leucoagaricus gongylophorus]